MNVTILGGTGLLGRTLAPLLEQRKHIVTVTGRSVPSHPAPGVRGVPVDLTTGEGLADAIHDAEIVVHLASDPLKARMVDVAGTAQLLKQIGDRHLLYISIVGVDRHPLSYYQSKFATERLIEDAGVLHTILRATQFHDFIAYVIGQMTRFPVGLIPRGFVFQPIDTWEIAEELARLVETRPQGMAPDLAGPEVLEVEHLARSLMTARGSERPLIRFPVPTPSGRAYRLGAHTNPGRAVGTVTWAEYLKRRFGG
jgi:uncharacterized protein YbjT (DUF2867 family)